jgi:hypothetical protein
LFNYTIPQTKLAASTHIFSPTVTKICQNSFAQTNIIAITINNEMETAIKPNRNRN